MKVTKQRPVNLDLHTIRFPITAIASITHRVSGVITLISVAILLWILSLSLSSPSGFESAANFIDGFFAKFILWGILTALAYHIVGGIRHILMDMKCFETLEAGTLSAQVTFSVTLLLSVFAGILVW
ncbi:succinate dehydrogenase cytochrome b556 subunit [Candidatus Enterovibrio altilux]|uniref:Succinate dehydrogenase cytochrome b556 subunit n=1 Tax=Candidatus Enterovibrio altilux TaxID=1927128 RepID=A0A291BBK3_9GAMM|nr:succinate dehydrogenase cytochrome b556 subunit [Candidatus Enterovibrio luxaltus]ATF10390.1 Succinate dehydrogenase cytochrome b-556 subunit [Candidatus Enterovibrio luxaltus]